MNKNQLVPPMFAAGAFTIPVSIDSMTRPDSIWIPFITEIPIFIVSYILFFIVNIVSVVPLSKLVSARTYHRLSGFLFSVTIAIVGSYLLFLADFFNKSTIFHSAYFFGSFLPLLVMTFSSYHYSATKLNHTKSNKHETNA